MRPGQIQDAVKQGATVLLPVGALESSKDDAPLGVPEPEFHKALLELAGDRKVVIAPPVWYAPTGYINGKAADGTFDIPTMTFVAYLQEVVLELRAAGFNKVQLVVLDKGQGEKSLIYAACKYVLGDYMNSYWKNPGTGKGWWTNPATKAMSWDTTGIELLNVPAASPVPKTVKLTLPLRLEQMRTSELREAIRQGLPCFVPAGVIENHGSHNPVAVDVFEAQDPLVLAAAKTPVVVGPSIWYGGTSYAVSNQQLGTLDISGDTFYYYTLGVVQGLAAMGFQRITFVHGHQGNGAQDTGIKLAAQEYKRLVATKAPGVNQKTVIDDMGVPGGTFDHGGKNETSWMLYLRQPYVNLSLIRPNDYMFCWYKDDESNTATYEWGKQMAEEALANYPKIIKERTVPLTPAPKKK
jgi:creatinine amidohydrolase/Fe(II)-dependent formamide hydrolase-like protein